jgi:hypothetical protein
MMANKAPSREVFGQYRGKSRLWRDPVTTDSIPPLGGCDEIGFLIQLCQIYEIDQRQPSNFESQLRYWFS